ncbi:Ctnnbl1 [Symbiodinium natans]|uniref:Ctnnbl1 protein n=1 Tax=Symbiodinium natans TaxID=878477 RepID=A0A812LLZ1_9DINO|nr:Ctnnbl1 [Symbiodinium natans]
MASAKVTSIVQSLCRYCTGTPVARVLNKFVENQFEKLERLLEMHEDRAQVFESVGILHKGGTEFCKA